MDEHESADLRQTLTRAGRLKLFPIELQFVKLIATGYTVLRGTSAVHWAVFVYDSVGASPQ